MQIPTIKDFSTIGSAALGYISVAESNINIPFDIKRVYWTYYTPNEVLRGGHAHKTLQQMIFAVSGKIIFNVEDRFSNTYRFELEKPRVGLYFPPYTWREIQFSHNAVLLCLASEHYDENDYIRDYEEYKNLQNTL